MSHWNAVNFFEQSTREYAPVSSESGSYQNSGPSPSTGAIPKRFFRRVCTSTAPQTPAAESGAEDDNDSSTQLLGAPYPQYSSVGIPEPANGQPVGQEQVVVERVVEEYRDTSVGALFTRYQFGVVEFRQSKLIHILQFMFCHIPISAIFMGYIFRHECDQKPDLPFYVLVSGIFGVFFLSLWVWFSIHEYSGAQLTGCEKNTFRTILAAFLIDVAVEMFLASRLRPSYDPSSEIYCNRFFYYYMIYRELASAGALVIAALVYLPGSCLVRTIRENYWCPQPASAFFNFR